MEIGDTVMIVTADPEPGWEEEYQRWLDQEHLLDRMAVRGFLGARRFLNVRAEGPKQMILFELENEAVLERQEFTKLSNPPTDWNQRVRQHFTAQRGVYKGTFSLQGEGEPTGKAVIAVWAKVEEGWEDEFNLWYNEEHLPERIGLGYLNARRFKAPDGSEWKYLAIYDVPDEAIVETPAYKERVASPTPWMQKMQQHMTIRPMLYRQEFTINGRWMRDGQLREKLT